MSQNQKHFVSILRIITGGILGFIIVAVIILSIQSETVAPIKPYPSVEKPMPKHCWNGGDGHPYPNQVMYNGTIRGQKVVDSLLEEMFENRPGPYNPDLVQYFCKR